MVDSGTFKTSFSNQTVPHYKEMRALADKRQERQTRKAPQRVGVLESLEVCFGGFCPTAMGDVFSKTAPTDKSIERMRLLRESKERAAAVEAARAGETCEYADEHGNVWRYVVLDNAFIRIERCEPASEVTCLPIPAVIDELPVVALADDALARLAAIEEVVFPDSVVRLGRCVLRLCPRLRSVTLPAQLNSFDADWLRGCSALQVLRLPGLLSKLTARVFDFPALEALALGPGVEEVAPGAFAKSRLTSIAVDAQNPFIETDGVALYTRGRETLLALAVPVTSYSLDSACRAIAEKGLSTMNALDEICLPEGLETIGDYAFMGTGIREITLPSSLRFIGERAFFSCPNLEAVSLNEGLRRISAHAFSKTPLTSLVIPSSVHELGKPLADQAPLTCTGPDAGLRVDQTREAVFGPYTLDGAFFLDKDGCLYQRIGTEVRLVTLLDAEAEECNIAPGCTAIEEGALAKHKAVTAVVLPEGLRTIGRRAFWGCKALRRVAFPDTLNRIGDEAFLDTALESAYIGSALSSIGSLALVSDGAHHGTGEPTLRTIEVDPFNPKYRKDGPLLLERLSNGRDRLLACEAFAENIRIPDSVSAIASYALSGLRRVRTLSLSEKAQAVDVRGLAFDCLVESLEVRLSELEGGNDAFMFRFPDTARAAQHLSLAFGACSSVDAATVFEHYDASIVQRGGFDAASDQQQLDVYDQVVRIVARLRDPVHLTRVNRGLMDAALRHSLREYCLQAARHADTATLGLLLDLGYINAGTIDEAIEAVGRVQDASVTNYLLEQKMRRFGADETDFDL